MRMHGHFDTTCRGIPCQVYIEAHQPPNCYADSDADYYGYTEWILLDRKGYPADWLYKRATDKDIDLINAEVQEYLLRSDDDY